MDDTFQLATGTVPGREHLLAAKNSHDAVVVRRSDEGVVAVVCDGCGSQPHSEVGAKLGAAILAKSALEQLIEHDRHCECERCMAPDDTPAAFWERVREDALLGLHQVAARIGGKWAETVEEYLLFTAVIALVTPETAQFVAIGDGVCIVNGERIPLGPFEGNAPPYIAYALQFMARKGMVPSALRFVPLRTLPASELRSFLIGTDGVEQLIQAEGLTYPGTDESIGSISRLWTEDKFYKNPDMVRRHLARANIAKPKGLLTDDTTLVVGRRKVGTP